LLGVGLSSLFIRKKNKLLKQKKDEITATSAKMEVLNSQLHLINDELKDTNQKRERLIKVYIDLCYKNIERNSKLRTLAVRKIKANQSKELLSLLSSSTNTEKENKEFLTEFDKAFLSLYPSFQTYKVSSEFPTEKSALFPESTFQWSYGQDILYNSHENRRLRRPIHFYNEAIPRPYAAPVLQKYYSNYSNWSFQPKNSDQPKLYMHPHYTIWYPKILSRNTPHFSS
jgi:hypothetical protein